MKKLLKIFRLKQVKKENKGFSLVEVLCAIVLLALVATPVVQALYSGLSLNIKSRKILGASDIRSGYSERVASYVYDDFTYTESGTDYTVNGYETDFAPDGSGVTKYTDIDADGFKYDVTLTCIDPGVSDSYFCYDVRVDVTEAGKTDVLCTSKVSIANKY